MSRQSLSAPPHFWTGVWRSLNTPARLRLCLAAAWLTAGLLGAASFAGVRAHRQGVQSLGRDAAPSIIAAQQVKTNLAAMHALAVLGLLDSQDRPGGEGASGSRNGRASDNTTADRAIGTRRRGATEALMVAAGNITYGDAERVPIRAMLEGLGPYEARLAEARLLHGRGDKAFVEPLRRADGLLQNTLLPAAEALDHANRAALDAGHDQARAAAGWAWAWLLVAGLAALAVFGATQVFLTRKMRRRVNPALAAATFAVLAGLVALGSVYAKAGGQLHRAKADCFESIHVLEQARADGYDMLAAQRLALLDPVRGAVYQARFRDRAARLASPPQGMAIDALVNQVTSQRLPAGRPGDEEAEARRWGELARQELPSDFKGHLAVELRNVTFAGEREAAVETLRAFAAFLAVDAQVQGRANKAEAVALAVRDDPGGATRAFAGFEAALGRTLTINHAEFDRAVERGFGAVRGWDWASLGLALGIGLLATLGLRPHLREYDFQS